MILLAQNEFKPWYSWNQDLIWGFFPPFHTEYKREKEELNLARAVEVQEATRASKLYLDF